MHHYANIAMEESFIVSTINFKKGTQSKFWETTPTINDLSYTTDNNRLYIADKIVGQSLDNLDVGRGNTINTTKGRFGGATIGKDNFLGRMGYYIYPDWETLSEDRCSVKVYFIDHQIGYYPEDVMIKMKKLAQQDNDDCLTNNHVFSCGSTCNGWEHYANLVGYSAYNLWFGVASLSGGFTYSDSTIYPEATFNFIGCKAIINKTTYNVLYSSIDREFNSSDGLTQFVISTTLTFDKALPNDVSTSLLWNYAIPTDIWTNDWTLSDPDQPEIGKFNIAEPTFAMGRCSKAYASESFAVGRDSKAYGDVSVALGVRNETKGAGSFAANGDNHSTGDWSATFGKGNYAENSQAAAFGSGNHAKGENSFTIGDSNTVETNAKNSLAAGYKNTVSGVRAAAFGAENNASGVDSLVAGNSNTVYNKANAAIGVGLTGAPVPATGTGLVGQVVVGAYNATLDNNTYFAVGTGSSSDKKTTLAVSSGKVNVTGGLDVSTTVTTKYISSSYFAHIGNGHTINSACSMAVGDQNTIEANSSNSFAVGYKNTISNVRAAAIGADNNVNGVDSVAIGNDNTTGKKATAAIGKGLDTGTNVPEGCVVVGAYNNPLADDTYFAVGTGSSSKKYNTFAVTHDGIEVAGSAAISGTATFNSHSEYVNCGINMQDVTDKGQGIIINRTRDGKKWTSAFYNSILDSKTCGTAIRRTVDDEQTNKMVMTDTATEFQKGLILGSGRIKFNTVGSDASTNVIVANYTGSSVSGKFSLVQGYNCDGLADGVLVGGDDCSTTTAYSFVRGKGLRCHRDGDPNTLSIGGTILGRFNSYTNSPDRVFEIGNGFNDADRSTAIRVREFGTDGGSIELPDLMLNGMYNYTFDLAHHGYVLLVTVRNSSTDRVLSSFVTVYPGGSETVEAVYLYNKGVYKARINGSSISGKFSVTAWSQNISVDSMMLAAEVTWHSVANHSITLVPLFEIPLSDGVALG